jgi:DNA-binding NtrC family response regulator
MTDRIRVLFVDDETDFLDYMTKRLTSRDLDVSAYSDPVQAWEAAQEQRFDVALLDLRMPGLEGDELLGRLKARDPHMEVVILTGHGTIETAFRTSKAGAFDFLQKPADFDEVVRAIAGAYARRVKALHRETAAVADSLLLRALDTSPLDVLRALRRLASRAEVNATAISLAEGGAPDAARELLEEVRRAKDPG